MVDEHDFFHEPFPRKPGSPTFLRWLIIRILAFFIYFPLLGRLVRRSFPFICLYVALLHQNNDYQGLYNILLKVLNGPTFRQDSRKHYWWFFMRLVISLMQEQQIRHLIINPDLEEQLIELGRRGPGDKKGYNVAYSFVGYSLWLFERAEINEAIDMVSLAAKADAQWGYPEYLLGWYGLFVGGEDSVEHFSKAVHIDWNFLHRMRRDRTCQQFPELLKEVNRNVLVVSKTSSDDEAGD